jgi:hypothetical protein
MKTTLPIIAVGALALSACSEPETDLFAQLSEHCGNAYQGAIVGDDPRDADWAGQVLVMHVRECSDSEIRIPLHVGEDRSRTWVVTRQGEGLRLKHDHRHEDGSEDVLTQYGGDTEGATFGQRAEFPADQFSRDLFEREGIPVSMDNVWSMTLTDDSFTYALDRPDRHFEAVFDLTTPVEAPPPPWGAQ